MAFRWYGLAYVVGLLGGLYYIFSLIKRDDLWGQSPPASQKDYNDFLVWAIIGVILGGRLGYVLFYHPAFFWAHPSQIIAIWQGGMAFHGGLLGVGLAVILFCHKRQISFWRFGDSLACATPIGLFFGRIANFINGELWGRPTNSAWGMVFPHIDNQKRHPSQIYEALLEGLLLFIILRIATHHFFLLKQEGKVMGLFLMGYGLARIFVEFFREPDRHIGYIADFLTMGMILSLPIFLLGLWFYVRPR